MMNHTVNHANTVTVKFIIAYGCKIDRITIHDLTTNSKKWIGENNKDILNVIDMQFSIDDLYLFLLYKNGKVEIYETTNYTLYKTVETKQINNSSATCMAIHYTGNLIAIGYEDSYVCVYNLLNDKDYFERIYSSSYLPITQIIFNPCQHNIFSVLSNDTFSPLFISDLNGNTISYFATNNSNITNPNFIKYSPNGTYLLFGDTRTNESVKVIDDNHNIKFTLKAGSSKGHLCDAIFTDDESTLITSYDNGNVYFWNMSTGKHTKIIRPSIKSSQCLALDMDNLAVANGSQIYVYSLKDFSLIEEVETGTDDKLIKHLTFKNGKGIVFFND